MELFRIIRMIGDYLRIVLDNRIHAAGIKIPRLLKWTRTNFEETRI